MSKTRKTTRTAKNRISPEGREAISKAAKKRWREWRRANGRKAKSK